MRSVIDSGNARSVHVASAERRDYSRFVRRVNYQSVEKRRVSLRLAPFSAASPGKRDAYPTFFNRLLWGFAPSRDSHPTFPAASESRGKNRDRVRLEKNLELPLDSPDVASIVGGVDVVMASLCRVA